MKYYSTFLSLVFLMGAAAFSQEKVVKYKVSEGETVNQIAVKFKVTPYDIYELNPDARKGVNGSTVLLIPSSKSAATLRSEETKSLNSESGKTSVRTHIVQPKETLFGIKKQYNISEEALKEANPILVTNGLQIGQTLTIPATKAYDKSVKNAVSKTKSAVQETYLYHDVLSKETKYSIAKKYGITVDELEAKNPEIIANLPVGYRLTIKGSAPSDKTVKNAVDNVVPKKVNDTRKETSTLNASNYTTYQIKSKETLYSLSKNFKISQDELKLINPLLAEGVQEGMIIKVPVANSTTSVSEQRKNVATIPSRNTDSIKNNNITRDNQTQIVETNAAVVELSKKTGISGRKKVALLLPFNLAKMQNDTTGINARIKSDKFLNMTLDFYAGAMAAVDSAKTLKLPIDISVYDSQETKSTSAIATLIAQNKLQDADVVVGPFYQSNAEIAANLLKPYNVPVVSPLSKDTGNPIENLFQTVPSTEVLRAAIFDYMRSKNGNIVAVVDRKKESVINYIKQNQKGVLFAATTETGALDVANLKSMLLPNRMNYVVMETANTAMVKATLKGLIDAQKSCQVQLVILEQNSTLDTDEINFLDLVKLKLMYPSVTRESEENGILIFEKEFRLKNKINPNTYATRGFDVMFDTMMRTVQGKTYQETTDLLTTEQIDNKFQFYKKADGGHANKGVYILYYDNDLTLKIAK